MVVVDEVDVEVVVVVEDEVDVVVEVVVVVEVEVVVVTPETSHSICKSKSVRFGGTPNFVSTNCKTSFGAKK